MNDMSFEVELAWSGTGRDGVGEIRTDDLSMELSGPEAMGGRGIGTNPEELLVCAVSSCYTATLFGVLSTRGLPAASLAVSATGTVSGFPGHARFARLVVSPTIVGADVGRRAEYEQAAGVAHERCFIGRTLSPEVAYEVGSVRLRGGAPEHAAQQSTPSRPAPEITDQPSPA